MAVVDFVVEGVVVVCILVCLIFRLQKNEMVKMLRCLDEGIRLERPLRVVGGMGGWVGCALSGDVRVRRGMIVVVVVVGGIVVGNVAVDLLRDVGDFVVVMIVLIEHFLVVIGY